MTQQAKMETKSYATRSVILKTEREKCILLR